MSLSEQSAPTAARPSFDVERVRADFPILYREVYGKPLVYLDNGASAQKPRAVLDTIQRAYDSEYANVHRGLHYLSNTATTRFEEARETVRRFLNAPSTDEIIFTRNATEAINLVAASYGAMAIGEGDEIITTPITFSATAAAAYYVGATVRIADVDPRSGNLDPASVEPLIGPIAELPLEGIHWVIVGGESGWRRRPVQEGWVREIRDQCRAAKVPFFFKQWGGSRPKANGRLLDDRTWDEMPFNPHDRIAAE